MKRNDPRQTVDELIREEEAFIEAKAKDGQHQGRQGFESPEKPQHSSINEQGLHKECEDEIRELKKKLMSADMSY